MSSQMQQIEDLKKQLAKAESAKQNVIQERDQALDDLSAVESAFSDVHRKYERAKSTLENFRKNEDVLKQRDEELVKSVQLRDSKIEHLKQEVQKTLEKMYQDYEIKLQKDESENVKLRALVRKSDMKIASLESDLEQKHKENAQLHALCDDLINGEGKKS